MTLQKEPSKLPEDFSGRVRLFPLPNLVMFPHVMQPLHIFEPRYRDLIEDALLNDQLLAMALLRPGWEADYEGRPAIEPVVCLGKVTAHAQDDQGYNIFLQGICRGVVENELPPVRSFREARIRVIEDEYPIGGAAERNRLQRHLVKCFRELMPSASSMREQFEQLLDHPLPLGKLTDIVTFSCGLGLAVKQQMLTEPNVDLRARLLVRHLQAAKGEPVENDDQVESRERAFPPDFSAN